MKKCFIYFQKIALISIFISVLHIVTAQENTNPFFRCLAGDYLNSPALNSWVKQNDQGIHMYNFLESKGHIDETIWIEKGKIVYILLDREENGLLLRENPFPEEWGIKTPYKAMYAKNKSFPKPKSKEEFERIHVRKYIDSLEISLEYGVSTYDYEDELFKWDQGLNSARIFGNAAYSEGCTVCDPPPPVWQDFIGEDGDQLCEWLCQNMGKPMDPVYIDNNFIPVIPRQSKKECPDNDYGYNRDYYDFHPYLPGDYYMSHDATMVIRIDQGAIRSLIFFPQLIPVRVLPSIDKTYHESDLLSMYPEMQEYEEERSYCTLQTSHFKFEFNLQMYNRLRSICIHLNDDRTDGGDPDQFPFVPGKLPAAIIYEMENITIGDKENWGEGSYDIFTWLNADSEFKCFHRDTYNFELVQGITANLTDRFSDGTYYAFIVEPEEGVTDVELELIDTESKTTLEKTSTVQGEPYTYLDFMADESANFYLDIKVKNAAAVYSDCKYKFKLYVYYLDVFKTLVMPEYLDEELRNSGFEYFDSEEKYACTEYYTTVSKYFVISTNTYYAICAVSLPIVSDIAVSLYMEKIDKMLAHSGGSEGVNHNIAITPNYLENVSGWGDVNLIIYEADTYRKHYPVKLYYYKKTVE